MNRNKYGIFSLVQAGIVAFLLSNTAILYANGGFGFAFGFSLALSVVVSAPVLLALFRRFGTFVLLAVTVAFGIGVFILTEDYGTAVLILSLCFSIPLAGGLLWNRNRTVLSFTQKALPLAGAIQAGGFFCYCKLHFGVWSPYAAVERMGGRISALVESMHDFYRQLYEGKMPSGMNEAMDLLAQNGEVMARQWIYLAVYALMGLFYISFLWADRAGQKQGQVSGCTHWAELIPPRGLSWCFMLGMIFVNVINIGPLYEAAVATFTLFGFFYVFAAVYILDRRLMKKGVHRGARLFIALLLLGAALFTAGDMLLSPYSILTYVGWFIATSRRRKI